MNSWYVRVRVCALKKPAKMLRNKTAALILRGRRVTEAYTRGKYVEYE